MRANIWTRFLVCVVVLGLAGSAKVRADEEYEGWEPKGDVDRSLDSFRQHLTTVSRWHKAGQIEPDRIENALRSLYARLYAGVPAQPSLWDRVRDQGTQVSAATVWRFMLVSRDYLVLERVLVQKAFRGWLGDQHMATFRRAVVHAHQRTELRGQLAEIFGDHAAALVPLMLDVKSRAQVASLGDGSLQSVMAEVYFAGQDSYASADGFGMVPQINAALKRGLEALAAAAEADRSGSNLRLIQLGEAIGSITAARIQAGWMLAGGKREQIDKLVGVLETGAFIASMFICTPVSLAIGGLSVVAMHLVPSLAGDALQQARGRLLSSGNVAAAAWASELATRLRTGATPGDPRLTSLVQPIENHLHDLELLDLE